jgi:hypothetical protein
MVAFGTGVQFILECQEATAYIGKLRLAGTAAEIVWSIAYCVVTDGKSCGYGNMTCGIKPNLLGEFYEAYRQNIRLNLARESAK